MKLPALDYDERLAIEEQLPHLPVPDVAFDMGRGMDIPDPKFMYIEPAKKPDTEVVSFDKRKYASMTDAAVRVQPLLKHRKLREYYRFQTARHFVFYCEKV